MLTQHTHVTDVTALKHKARAPSLTVSTNLCAVSGIVEVFFGVGVRHAGRVTTHNVEVRPRRHPSFTVPLHLHTVANRP